MQPRHAAGSIVQYMVYGAPGASGPGVRKIAGRSLSDGRGRVAIRRQSTAVWTVVEAQRKVNRVGMFRVRSTVVGALGWRGKTAQNPVALKISYEKESVRIRPLRLEVPIA